MLCSISNEQHNFADILNDTDIIINKNKTASLKFKSSNEYYVKCAKQGDKLKYKCEYKYAINHYTNAIKYFNNKGTISIADLYMKRGSGYLMCKKYKLAQKDFTMTITKYGDNVRYNNKLAAAYFNRGLTLFSLKYYKSALKNFNSTIQKNRTY